MVESGMVSIKPPPNTGVGMRKVRLRVFEKSGWLMAHPDGLSERPVMVKRSCTPPSGETVGIADESHLADWPVDLEERRNHISGSHRGGLQNLRVIGGRAGSSHCRKHVTATARIEIEPRPQTFLHVFGFRKLRYAEIGKQR